MLKLLLIGVVAYIAANIHWVLGPVVVYLGYGLLEEHEANLRDFPEH